jgi:hypothetical protein
LKEKVDVVLTKGATPETGKLNNYDLKVVIQWFKRDCVKVMPNNKEGLLLHYQQTHTIDAHDRGGAYLYEDMATTVDGCQEASYSPSDSRANSKNFALADAGSIAGAYVAPTRVAPIIATSTAVTFTNTAADIAIDSAPTVLANGDTTTDAPTYDSHQMSLQMPLL